MTELQAFVYVFNLLQVPNVAWQSYLQLSLHFAPWLLVRRCTTLRAYCILGSYPIGALLPLSVSLLSLYVVQGAMVVLGSFMTFAGVLAYKYFFFKTSWRKIYLWSVVLTTFFSLLQLLLIFQVS